MPGLTYDERLARAVRDGEGDATRAALTLFERREPESLVQAIELVAPDGPLAPQLFDRLTRAYDVYRHARDMPCD